MAGHQLFSLLITGACMLIWVLWKWQRQRPRKQPPYPAKDALVIANLQQMGSNMEMPHLLEFFFYFPTEEAATSVEQVLLAEGFATQTKKIFESSGVWSLVMTKHMLPDTEMVEALRDMFDRLVEPVEGEYDGFGAGIET